jgi:hypothetical protein
MDAETTSHLEIKKEEFSGGQVVGRQKPAHHQAGVLLVFCEVCIEVCLVSSVHFFVADLIACRLIYS